MYKFKDFVKYLNEARIFAHLDSTYVFNLSNHSKVPSDIVDLTFNSCKIDDMQGEHSMFFVSGSSRVQEINHEKALEHLKKRDTSLLKDNEGKNVFLIVDGRETSILTQKKKSNETTTNVKEGMVVYFYYSGIKEIPNEQNAEKIIEHLKSMTVPSESLDPKSVKELKDYLNNLFLDKIAIKNLIDFWSSGYTLSNHMDPKDHTILRSNLFNEIRRLGNTLTKFPPDKWCPGDVYVADSKSINLIYSYLSEIQSNIQEDSIAKLNDLFSDEFRTSNEKGDARGSIVAVSLKQEQAQAGKAKEFLKTLSKDQTEYNVTDDEYNLSDSEIEKKIEDLRDIIANSTNRSEISVILNQDRGYKNSDSVALRKKYASLKICSKLVGDSSQLDDNILKSAAFAMSLTGVNPTFFKLMGSSKGNAKIDKFTKGDMIYLLDHGLGSKGSQIEIIDRNSSSEVIFKFRIKKGELEQNVVLKARPNGSKQSTLEIEKLK
jgi:hypothetical protein